MNTPPADQTASLLGSVPLWTLAAAVTLGVVVGFQPGINATFGKSLGSPIYGALNNNIVGIAAMTTLYLCLLTFSPSTPSLPEALSRVGSPPWWAWVGGLCGASYVIASIFLAPKMGIALLFTCMLLGQLCVSLAIDNFGLVGQPKKPISLGRIAGIALVLAGLIVSYLSSAKS